MSKCARAVIVAMAMISCAWLAGCQPPKGYVAREWSETMRELQIIPVFPPREDVVVGDVYLAPTSPEEAEREFRKKRKNVPIQNWIHRLDVNQMVSDLYGRTPSFPETSSAVTMANAITMPQPTASGDVFTTSGQRNRLRLVGFPEFMSTSYTQGDLSALVPVEAIAAGFAFRGSKAKAVRLSVPVAESYGLPLHRFLDKHGHIDAFREEVLPVKLVDFLYPDRKTRPPGTLGWFLLINEVYYARVIDISVETSEEFGAGARARPTVPIGSGGASGASPAVGGNATADTPASRAQALNEQLGQDLDNATPGGTLRFVSVSDRSVSMRRTFQRPVAIGYRGVWITLAQVVGADGKTALAISETRPIQGAQPTNVTQPVDTGLDGDQGGDTGDPFSDATTEPRPGGGG